MQRVRQFLHLISLVGVLAIATSCIYDTAIQQLPPAERAAFRAYRKMMTSQQAYTYLSKATTAERAAYLEAIGIARRFQALEPQDRESVLAGYIKKGMSAEALRFLWGEPYRADGRTGHYEDWQYMGPAASLTEYGNVYGDAGTMVFVRLVNDRVEWWIETVPAGIDESDDSSRIR